MVPLRVACSGGKLWRLEASGLRSAAGPCEEVLHWLEAVRFHKHILVGAMDCS